MYYYQQCVIASNKKYHYQFSQAFFPIPKGLSTEEGSYEAWWRLDYDKKRIFQRDENYSAYVLQAFGFTNLNGNRLASHKEKKILHHKPKFCTT